MTSTLAEKLPEIVKWIESNPLIVTLTSGGAVVWLFANLRSILNAIASSIKACISFTVTNTYEDARGYGGGFNIKMKQMVFNNFLSQTKAWWERTVNVDLSNAIDASRFENDTDATQSYESGFSPGIYDESAFKVASKMVNTYGFSVRTIFGKLCFVDRSYKLDGQRITVNTSIRVFFASKKKFMKKLEDKINGEVLSAIEAMNGSNFVKVYTANAFAGCKLKRSLSSIFTKDNVHVDLFNSIKSFIDSKDIYKKLNYPYNYCGLLYGQPGTGKTSTILAIASELKRDVYYINLAQTDSTALLKALNDNPSRTIFVFEDIDAVSYKGADARVDSEDGGQDSQSGVVAKAFGIPLSDLLNLTDGLLASDGTICLFTTNHIEKLDPAFLRAGRMNKSVEFTYMEPDVAKKMVEAYLDVSIDNMIDNIKPAELQESILDVLLKKKTIEDLKKDFCKKKATR